MNATPTHPYRTNDNGYHGPGEMQYICSSGPSSHNSFGQPAASCTFGRFQNKRPGWSRRV
ncbi:hypothetical protein QBC32DRAFT_31135, partial [Pseudoneurospora amorphoporcata]